MHLLILFFFIMSMYNEVANQNDCKKFILNKLNLEPIIIKIMDQDEGKGWSFDYALAISEEYRKYLVLCLQNPDIAVVPSKEVDNFWHYHILDTQKYAEDCQACFGYFLHHFPYFGMRSEQDAKNLQTAGQQTLDLYISEFGKVPKKLWTENGRCPKCGVGSKKYDNPPKPNDKANNFLIDKRLSFADYRLNK